MSPIVPVNDSNTYQRPSATATRAIISDPAVPSDMAPEHHTTPAHPAHSHAKHGQNSRAVPPKNYEQALADRAVSTTSDSSAAEPKVVAGLAYRGNNADATTNGPGVLGRQQSFSTADQKRARMERMLSSDSSKQGGYTTTSKQ